MFNNKEVEVAEILLQLPSLVFAEQTKRFIRYSWGYKRKRTDAVEPSLPSSPLETLKASSPSTPFSFCPSDQSDEKPSKAPKQIIQTPETRSKKFQERLGKIKLHEPDGQKLLRHYEDMLKSTLANKTKSPELTPEIRHEVQVPQLDLEMRLGLPTINRDEQEPQNSVQQQNQQQITMQSEVMKEETIMTMGNNVGESSSKILPLFPGRGLIRDTERHVNAIPQAGQFCLCMDSAISLDRSTAKRAREWRVKILRENRSNRLKFFKH